MTIASGRPLPAFDLHCPLMSPPLALATELATIPAAIPYIHARADRVERWRSRLDVAPSPRIGVVWAGSGGHVHNHHRSIPLQHFSTIFAASRWSSSASRRVISVDPGSPRELDVISGSSPDQVATGYPFGHRSCRRPEHDSSDRLVDRASARSGLSANAVMRHNAGRIAGRSAVAPTGDAPSRIAPRTVERLSCVSAGLCAAGTARTSSRFASHQYR